MNLLTDDTTAVDFEAAAETQRAEAFRASPLWRDRPLLWTSSRESLYYWLRTAARPLNAAAREAVARAKDAKGGADEAALTEAASKLVTESMAENGPDNTYYRNAMIILWLAAHHCEDWQHCTHDKIRFLNMIDQWTDDHVTTSEMMEVAAITNKLIADAESTRAIPRPNGKAPEQSGN